MQAEVRIKFGGRCDRYVGFRISQAHVCVNRELFALFAFSEGQPLPHRVAHQRFLKVADRIAEQRPLVKKPAIVKTLDGGAGLRRIGHIQGALTNARLQQSRIFCGREGTALTSESLADQHTTVSS